MRTIRVLAIVVLAFASVGCGALTRTDAERIENLWKVLGPRHREYIQKDPALAGPANAESKAIRLETVDRMDAAVKDALEASK